MLLELSITDFAIIEHLDIEFQSGMTVLTGETGAGKSIIIDAVSLLAGGRSSHDFIRTGAKKAVIQGSFALDKQNLAYSILDQLGIDHSDGTVIIEREIFSNGRNSCRVNGILVNISNLKKIGETIVDIQGQNDHQDLMNVEKHINLLDEYAEPSIQNPLGDYRNTFDKYVKLKAINDKRLKNEKQWAQRVDMLNFQIHEIESAKLTPNEDTDLESERDRLNNFQRIHDALINSYQQIDSDENSSLDAIGSAMSNMQEIESLDKSFHEISENLSGAFYALQDAASQINDQLSNLEFDQSRLDAVEQRLDTISQLKHKYGDSVEQILDYESKIKKELADMQGTQNAQDNIASQLSNLKQELIQKSAKLSMIRKTAAANLEHEVAQQLADLYMGKAVFEVHITENQVLNRNGRDSVEFYIQTNPGEKMLPLVKSASGGELSRIMLALKTMFARAAGVTSIIFDEVDTGVSGRVAQAIGNKIYTISTRSQVLCITHLPQVAAMSDQHFFIQKKVANNRTTTSVQKLDNQNNIDEIARMLAGTEVTKLTREHAEELIKLANQEKAKIKKIA